MPQRIKFAAPRARPRADLVESKVERDRFYSGKRWRDLRRAFLKSFPLCPRCRENGMTTAATVVHHKIERLEDPSLAYAWENLESLCAPHHTAHHKGRLPWHRKPTGKQEHE